MTTSDLDNRTPDRPASIDDAFVARLIEYIESDVALEDAAIVGQTDLLLTGLVDSLGVVVIVEWLEAELDIEIDPGDVVLENFQTVDAMVEFLRAT